MTARTPGLQTADRAFYLVERPRRNRQSLGLRRLVRETGLEPAHLVLPVFVAEGHDRREPIAAMPGCERLGIDHVVALGRRALQLGVPALALFPVLPDQRKDRFATESKNPAGLLQQAVRALKQAVPELVVITDVAMDPYSSDGHDGLLAEGEIANDPTLPILAAMALAQAEAGADLVAPSDMMDGRVGFLRQALDEAGHTRVGILAYSVKYASAFYGPFRQALDSAPRQGDKQTYQMDPCNLREALREVRLDVAQGADIVMVKPALPYLDVVAAVRAAVDVPVAAYSVSGEYAMIKHAARAGALDEKAALLESLLGIRRAGADIILTYAALEVAELLQGGRA
ncbi:MAG: porphobilinogen synthase [Proteobacteria bacterium]|nr:porphobilinogen synthase [Pseudomonadota bacterium]